MNAYAYDFVLKLSALSPYTNFSWHTMNREYLEISPEILKCSIVRVLTTQVC